ncbi:hypothetical protein O987_25477 [Comamonas testosteroni TK102]|uniref:Uncharacterized protein n=1 Tax=Comamonas testosteroni TK102 TaxID=1392005 RepID=A0A076PZB2_COMTE|nr:hypothetical protein O987_25477 [Comamonas testosteroni TK102]
MRMAWGGAAWAREPNNKPRAARAARRPQGREIREWIICSLSKAKACPGAALVARRRAGPEREKFGREIAAAQRAASLLAMSVPAKKSDLASV